MSKLYALYNEDTFVQFTTEIPFTGTPKLKEFADETGTPIKYTRVLDWHDMRDSSKELVTFLAQKATEQFGTLYLPTSRNGSNFGIVKAPKIGDLVSHYFNGDYTPCGEVVRITPKFTVITSTGNRFSRNKDTGTWLEGGTFSLIEGHIDERNPHI